MLNKLDKQVEGSLKSQYSNTTNTSTESENEITNSENIIQENVSYTVPVNTSTENNGNEINSNSVSNEIDEDELNTINNMENDINYNEE